MLQKEKTFKKILGPNDQISIFLSTAKFSLSICVTFLCTHARYCLIFGHHTKLKNIHSKQKHASRIREANTYQTILKKLNDLNQGDHSLNTGRK